MIYNIYIYDVLTHGSWVPTLLNSHRDGECDMN